MAVLVGGMKRWSRWLSTSWGWIWPMLAEFYFSLYSSFFLGGSKLPVMDLLLKVNLCWMGNSVPQGASALELAGSPCVGEHICHVPVTWGQATASKQAQPALALHKPVM